MASLIPGYNYDIFISYRQKDNKHDGWVTEFVDNLKGELESTFKEEISVYFDINPSDYLLETYDVDASLKDKLKCLIFIPIISRTYCDPKSFAWEHEFKAFVEQASRDQYGLKVKLSNGNVASRVLPVRIHDLDPSDIKECESVLGGVLRGIDFIYKEAGIDKPLAPGDNEKKNLNNTTYRIQIIKVAHSIKEITLGMKNEPIQVVSEKDRPEESVKEAKAKEPEEVMEKPGKLSKVKFLIPLTILVLLIIAGIISYPKIFKRNTLDRLKSSGERISVAVMPFQNMTSDTTWNVWQKGIQDMIITSLSKFPEELIVRQTESTNDFIQSKGIENYASITPGLAGKISRKLNTNIFVFGNIKQAGTTLRIYAQLIDSKTEEIIKSFQIESYKKEENIFRIIDSVSLIIEDFLLISKIDKELPLTLKQKVTTNTPEAFRNFIFGENAYYKRDFLTASKFYLEALTSDSAFVEAGIRLSYSYIWQTPPNFDEAKKWCLKIYRERDQLSMMNKIKINILYAQIFETPYEVIKYRKQLLNYDDQNPSTYYNIGFSYFYWNQYEEAIPWLEKALDIYDKWNTKPLWINNYYFLGLAYHHTSQFKKEKKLYKKAEKDFPATLRLLYCQSLLSLSEGDTVAANKYIEKYKSLLKKEDRTETWIITSLGSLYRDAGILDAAEKYYRKSLLILPGNSDKMNDLAWFLIDKDRNVSEGLKLVDSALESQPDNYNFLDCKGWGLYKQGKYQEALDMLQKSWDIRMKEAIYSHIPFLHLEAAKKAVANQKNK